MPCNIAGSQQNLMRVQVRNWINQITHSNPKILSNILHAIHSIRQVN